MRRAGKFKTILVSIPLLLLVAACDDFPKDPEGTLDRVRGGTVYAGIVENPPWAVSEDKSAKGIEVQIVEEFAASLDAEVHWAGISGPAAMRALEERKLDIVVGGFLQTDPWKSKVGFSRPYIHGTKRVMAVPKGENAWLVALETYLSRHESEARDLLAETRQ